MSSPIISTLVSLQRFEDFSPQFSQSVLFEFEGGLTIYTLWLCGTTPHGCDVQMTEAQIVTLRDVLNSKLNDFEELRKASASIAHAVVQEAIDEPSHPVEDVRADELSGDITMPITYRGFTIELNEYGSFNCVAVNCFSARTLAECQRAIDCYIQRSGKVTWQDSDI